MDGLCRSPRLYVLWPPGFESVAGSIFNVDGETLLTQARRTPHYKAPLARILLFFFHQQHES